MDIRAEPAWPLREAGKNSRVCDRHSLATPETAPDAVCCQDHGVAEIHGSYSRIHRNDVKLLGSSFFLHPNPPGSPDCMSSMILKRQRAL